MFALKSSCQDFTYIKALRTWLLLNYISKIDENAIPIMTRSTFIFWIATLPPRPAKFILRATAFVMMLDIMRRVVSAMSLPPIDPR